MKSGQIRWDVRYRAPGDFRVITRSFDSERAAKGFRAQAEVDIERGELVDPRRQEITVADWCDEWLKGKTNLAPTTRERYQIIVDVQVRPRWSKITLKNIRHAQIQSWLAGLEMAPASVRKVHRVLSQALDFAVKDGRLSSNPAKAVSLPRLLSKEKLYLTHEQVAELAERCGSQYPEYGTVVRFLAYTGLRWGEMAALRVKNVDFKRQRVTVAESVTPVKGVMTFGPTKGNECREVPMPRSMVKELTVFTRGKKPGDLVFAAPFGGVLRSQGFQRTALKEASEAMGLQGFTPHMLRHTAASLAIASGADVKVIQTMLGHKSATMTLDLYGHLFGDRLDAVADAMETARATALKQRPRAAAIAGECAAEDVDQHALEMNTASQTTSVQGHGERSEKPA